MNPAHAIQHYTGVRDMLIEAGYIIDTPTDIEEWFASAKTGFEITLPSDSGDILFTDFIEVKGRKNMYSVVIHLAQKAAIEKFKHQITKIEL